MHNFHEDELACIYHKLIASFGALSWNQGRLANFQFLILIFFLLMFRARAVWPNRLTKNRIQWHKTKASSNPALCISCK